MYNPGALMRINRHVSSQPIIPGGSRYDLGKPDGGVGRHIPAVGRYPSSGPWGNYIPHPLSDGADGPFGPYAPYFVGGLLVAVLLWNLRK